MQFFQLTQSWKYLAGIVSLVGVAFLIYQSYNARTRRGELDNAAGAISGQINYAGNNLAPGEISYIHISKNSADEVILVPYGYSKSELMRKFPQRPSIVNTLADLSGSDNASPALVWLDNNRVIGTSKLRLSVAVNFVIDSWTLNGSIDIPVKKEESSINPFLSLFILHDDEINNNQLGTDPIQQ